jgi:hypothetical protein
MDAVAESIDITIVVLAVLNTEVLKAINYRLIGVEIAQVFCPNLPRRFPKVQSLDKAF